MLLHGAEHVLDGKVGIFRTEHRDRRIEMLEDVLPVQANRKQMIQGLLAFGFQHVGTGFAVLVLQQRQFAFEEVLQRHGHLQFVLDRKLNVDAFDAVRIITQTRQRDHYVLVDLEGVGVLGDGGGAGAVEPELLARLGRDRDEAFATAGIGETHDMRGGFADAVFLVAGDIGDQHHLRPFVTAGLGRITDRPQIAFVQMLQTRKQGVRMGVEIILDLDDGRHGQRHVAKELQTNRAHMLGHSVQDEGGRRNETVAAFLLNAGQAGQKLVGDVLAEADLAEAGAGDLEDFRLRLQGLAVDVVTADFETGQRNVVNLAQIMIEPLDFEPGRIRRHHAPGGEVIQRRTPQHGLLAAGVHRHVTADTGGIGRRRVDREFQARLVRRLHDAARHDAGATADRRHLAADARQRCHFDAAQRIQLFGIDHGRHLGQRHGATGVAGTAPARDDGQAEFDQRLDDGGDLFLGIRIDDDKGIFNAPVGGVGHMRNAGQPVELDVVLARDAAQSGERLLAQVLGLAEVVLEIRHRLARRDHQLQHLGIAVAALVDRANAMLHGINQCLAALLVGQQVILQIGVARDHPEVAQHLEQHARGAAGLAFVAQLVQHIPDFFAEESNDDFAVRIGGVVIGNFAQTGCHMPDWVK